MNIEKSIVTALEYERKVAAMYERAAGAVSDESGRRVLQMLGKEERFHVTYLEQRLAEWRVNGRVSAQELQTAVPPRKAIDRAIAGLERTAAPAPRDADLQMLWKAREIEDETTAFYRKMVAELPGEGGALYRRFVEIEEGHALIVQCEIDALTKTGFWFEFRETDLED